MSNDDAPHDIIKPPQHIETIPLRPLHTNTRILEKYISSAVKMVKLEEVMDEEFVREQDGPHDDDDWDTDSGMTISFPSHSIALETVIPNWYQVISVQDTNSNSRFRHFLHPLLPHRRNLDRAHHRPARHHSRINPPLSVLELQHDNIVVEVRASVWRKDIVGCEHECAATGSAVGIGV